MKTIIFRHFAATLLSVSLLAACASTPAPPTLRHGEPISIRSDDQGRVDVSVDSKATKAGKGAAAGFAGAVGGVVLGGFGGAVAGMACGPLAFVCVPVAAAAGAGAGGVTGGAMGASYAGRGGVSGPKAEIFNELAVSALDQQRAMSALRGRFEQQASLYWDVRNDSANQVVVRMTSLHFEQPGNEQIRLVLRAEMDLTFGERTRTIHLQEATPARHVDYWIADNGAKLGTELDAILHAMAYAMVGRITPGRPLTASTHSSS